MKKVLVMCTGNSCRSIIAEALINAELDSIKAYSCGVSPSGKIDPFAKRVLEQNGICSKNYRSKDLKEVLDIDFDLVVTVCNHAKESCPIFPKPTKRIHIGFEDPSGKSYEEFVKTFHDIKKRLIPKIKEVIK